MHISHTIPTRAPSGPIRLTLDLLPSSAAIVRINAVIGIRCGHGTIHLVPIARTITVTWKSPDVLLDAVEDMIRYYARGRETMADLLIGMCLSEWVDPCDEPADDDPEIVDQGEDG